MKRYIVTEDELDNLIDMARDYGHNHGLKAVDAVCLSQARADCTKHEVPEWATHFAYITWDSVDLNNPMEHLERFKAIGPVIAR